MTAARALIRDVISDTPVMHSRVLSETVGGPVFMKCENLQRTGSFKVRGAYARIARLSDAERARGVVAASAGNHAQGVAFAAGRLGCAATVVMPAGAPLPKVQATRGYGADVILQGTCVEDAVSEALNSKIQWIKYTARGFRSREGYRRAIYFHCGGLDLYPQGI